MEHVKMCPIRQSECNTEECMFWMSFFSNSKPYCALVQLAGSLVSIDDAINMISRRGTDNEY
jgi:hypothetical protein